MLPKSCVVYSALWMRWKAWSLVGLEDPIAEDVLFRQREIRLNVRWHYLLELRARRAIRGVSAGNQIRSVHRCVELALASAPVTETE